MLRYATVCYTFDDYQRDADRTARHDASRITTSVLGLAGEVGELASELQHVMEQEREIDLANVREELGDVLWRVADLCSALGFDMSDVAQANIAKLRKRYPNGFTAQDSAARADKVE